MVRAATSGCEQQWEFESEPSRSMPKEALRWHHILAVGLETDDEHKLNSSPQELNW